LGDPLGDVLERLLFGDVVANDSYGGILNVLGDEAVELFLARSIPYLHPHHLVVHVYGFGQEIDPYSSFLFAVVSVLGKPEYNTGFAYRLVTQKHDFVLQKHLV
jgi:hypothetical protein